MQEKEQKKSPIKQRILSFVDYLGISKREFYAKTGISRGTLESNTGITEDIITKFIATYPYIHISWLITGTGEMLQETENNIIDKKKSSLHVIEKTNQNEQNKVQSITNNFYTNENLQKWLTFLIANLNKENEYNGYLPLFLKLNYIVMAFNRYLPETQFNEIYQSYLITQDEGTLLKQFPSVITNIIDTSEQLTSYETEINQIYNLTKEIAKKVGIIRK